MFIKAILSILYFSLSLAQEPLTSPCPRLFTYEPQKERDRWFGVVTLISESDLSGVWLRLVFDRPSLQLGNWFGEIKTTDNMEYLVKNRNHQLKANMPYALRFYIKYDPSEPPPRLIAFRLNAKTVCPEGESTTPAAITGGNLQTSGPASPGETTAASIAPRPQPMQGPSTTFSRPGGGWSPQGAVNTDDDDVFLGDFQLINRPQLRPDLDVQCGTVVRGRVKRQQGARLSRVNERDMYFFNGRPVHDQGFYSFLSEFLTGINRGQQVYAQTQPKPLITYGQSTREGEFPWHVALYHERGPDLQYICGASLISHYHVITVAHCVTRRRSQTTLNPDSLVVYLGKYYLKKWSNPGIQDSQVSMIFPHPHYNSQTYANDIAIIKLVNSAMYTDYVRPICLWSGGDDLNLMVNKAGTVVGWGFDHTGKVTEELTQAKMPVVLKETCIYSFPDFFSRFTTNKTFCAGFRNGTSVCNGDSGGGMVFPKTLSDNRQVWQLRGLVSISVALQNQFKCDSSHYVVFTDVAKYLDWIKTAMQK